MGFNEGGLYELGFVKDFYSYNGVNNKGGLYCKNSSKNKSGYYNYYKEVFLFGFGWFWIFCIFKYFWNLDVLWENF